MTLAQLKVFVLVSRLGSVELPRPRWESASRPYLKRLPRCVNISTIR